MQRACVAGAIQVGTYDQFRETFLQWGVKDTFTNVFYASMASGLLFAGFSMPLETEKNKMAFQKPDPITGIKNAPSNSRLPLHPSSNVTHPLNTL